MKTASSLPFSVTTSTLQTALIKHLLAFWQVDQNWKNILKINWFLTPVNFYYSFYCELVTLCLLIWRLRFIQLRIWSCLWLLWLQCNYSSFVSFLECLFHDVKYSHHFPPIIFKDSAARLHEKFSSNALDFNVYMFNIHVLVLYNKADIEICSQVNRCMFTFLFKLKLLLFWPRSQLLVGLPTAQVKLCFSFYSDRKG